MPRSLVRLSGSNLDQAPEMAAILRSECRDPSRTTLGRVKWRILYQNGFSFEILNEGFGDQDT
jgi:hypothetical protein